MRSVPRAAANDRDRLGAALPSSNRAAHSHPDGERPPEPVLDLSRDLMDFGLGSHDDGPTDLSDGQWAAALGDGIAMTWLGAP
jgi:hypothetical protein